MQLTKNFTLAELLHSDTANEHGITEQYNPPLDVRVNLKLLAEKILQPLRDEVGPIRITSGYRCGRVNALVKGQRTSQHLIGEAADIQGVGVSNAELFKMIQRLKLPFDQLIWEFGTKAEPRWVHISFGPKHRRQVLYIPKHLRP